MKDNLSVESSLLVSHWLKSTAWFFSEFYLVQADSGKGRASRGPFQVTHKGWTYSAVQRQMYSLQEALGLIPSTRGKKRSQNTCAVVLPHQATHPGAHLSVQQWWWRLGTQLTWSWWPNTQWATYTGSIQCVQMLRFLICFCCFNWLFYDNFKFTTKLSRRHLPHMQPISPLTLCTRVVHLLQSMNLCH